MGVVPRIPLSRLIAASPKLERQIKTTLVRQDAMVRRVWDKEMRPLMRQTVDDIIRQLQTMDLTDWQIYNINRIRDSINLTVRSFDERFAAEMLDSQSLLADFSFDRAFGQVELVGLKTPSRALIGPELIEAIKPVTREFVKYWADDMARIINTTITQGIIRADSPSTVAHELKKQFGFDTEQIRKLEEKKEELLHQVERGRISQKTYREKVKPINQKLNSGSKMSYARAERIARTELETASSKASFEFSKMVGELNPDAVKVWIWSHKPNGRPEHEEAEKQYRANPIRPDEPFFVGGEACWFPRDPQLSPAQRVSCGCTMATLPKDQVATLLAV